MKLSRYLKSIFMPLLAASYPVVFLYSINADVLEIQSIVLPVVGAALLGLIVFGLFLLFQRNALSASLSASAFFVFFYSYQAIFQFLLQKDIFTVEHYLLLPVLVVLAGYLGYLTHLLKPGFLAAVQNITLLLLVVLVGYNLTTAVPQEIQKAQARKAAVVKPVAQAVAASGQVYPDIYFIILDEYAGFDAIREYWHDDYVDDFERFLKERDFFIAAKSRSLTETTLVEIASRLNLRPFIDNQTVKYYFDDITDNKVMELVKSKGYTTVVFDGLALAYPSHPAIQADYSLQYDKKTMGHAGSPVDPFAEMVLDRSMLCVFSNIYGLGDATSTKNRNMTFFTMKKLPDLGDVNSPKFVYAHILFPHSPFTFNEYGVTLHPRYKADWNYYLGQHKYATKQVMLLIEKLLENADQDNPPVIIIQSDHGARNKQTRTANSVLLKDYPDQYKRYILNTLYLPGYDTSSLPEDLDPMYTFEIVLNHYLDLDVKVEK